MVQDIRMRLKPFADDVVEANQKKMMNVLNVVQTLCKLILKGQLQLNQKDHLDE